MCVCVLFGLYIIQPVFAARSPNEKKKKRKKGKKSAIFTQGSQLSAIVAVLYRMKRRRKGFFYRKMKRECVLFEWCGRRFRKKKEKAVILGRVCPGEGVLVLLFLCVIPCSSHSLLLCLCCNVLLLCILLAGRARC